MSSTTLTPTPTPTQSHSRKLPIKRKSSNPPNPNPQSPDDPPFKFHRIWSESDEIRFLQGLLGCSSQNLLFPRDLNLFFDTFSESMPQPYTRSQLSEKLRRLKKKFRVVSGRIARGLDPARLAPHDRDLLHLSTRLWHPSYASSSPFSAEGGSSGNGNKRRRPNPNVPDIVGRNGEINEGNEMNVMPGTPAQNEVLLAIEAVPRDVDVVGDGVKIELGDEVILSELPAPMEVKLEGGEEVKLDDNDGLKDEMTGLPEKSVKDGTAGMLVKSILDVFDGCVREAEAKMGCEGAVVSEMERRWRELRIAEMDVMVKRLRLVYEDGTGH